LGVRWGKQIPSEISKVRQKLRVEIPPNCLKTTCSRHFGLEGFGSEPRPFEQFLYQLGPSLALGVPGSEYDGFSPAFITGSLDESARIARSDCCSGSHLLKKCAVNKVDGPILWAS
jgi:hypothetical protein